MFVKGSTNCVKKVGREGYDLVSLNVPKLAIRGANPKRAL